MATRQAIGCRVRRRAGALLLRLAPRVRGAQRLLGWCRRALEAVLILALLASMLVVIAIGTWRDLAGQEVLLSEPPPSAAPGEADILYEPEPDPARPRVSTSSPPAAGSGTRSRGSSPVTVSGTTLWVCLNVPLLYVGFLVQRRLRRWYGTLRRASEDSTHGDDRERLSDAATETAADEAVVGPGPTEEDEKNVPEVELSARAADDETGSVAHDSRVAPCAVGPPTDDADGRAVPSPSQRSSLGESGSGSAVLLYDRRSERRIDFDVLGVLKYPHGNTLVRTVDLSVSMIVCRLPSDPHAGALRNGTVAEITVRLDDEAVVLPVLVAWRRTDGEVHTVGLQFRTLGVREEALLRAVVTAASEA